MSRARGSTAYRVLDEPVPGSLAHLVVNPFWNLLVGMLGGLWIALPWFVVNGIAMGSATKKREMIIAAACLAAVVVASLGVLLMLEPLVREQKVDLIVLRFCVLGIQLLKLGSYYWLHAIQSRSFGLHEYYGGTVRNGAAVVVAAAIARTYIVQIFDKIPLLLLVLT